jgi:hypothetical protein
MSKPIELSDEEYQILERAAAAGHETPEQVIRRIVRALADSDGPVYYTVEEMFDALDAYAARADAGEADADE